MTLKTLCRLTAKATDKGVLCDCKRPADCRHEDLRHPASPEPISKREELPAEMELPHFEDGRPQGDLFPEED